MTSEPWRDRAACLGVPTELFFPDPGEHELFDMAFSFCRKCPVVAECAAYAEQVGARHGIAKETGINVRTVYRVRESVTPEHERATA